MPRGISETDVWTACDALLLEGARPTIERVRHKIGSGSPNTVSGYLETWFKHLGGRIKDPGAFSAPSDLPDPILQAAKHFWQTAQAESRLDFDERLKEAMASSIANVEAEKEKAVLAEAAASDAKARLARLESDAFALASTLEEERRSRVALETRLEAAGEQLDQGRQSLDLTNQQLAAFRLENKSALAESLARVAAAEKRAALDMVAERQARSKADKHAEALERKLATLRAELLAANERWVKANSTLEAESVQLRAQAEDWHRGQEALKEQVRELNELLSVQRDAAASARGEATAAQELFKGLSLRTRPTKPTATRLKKQPGPR